MKHRSTMMQHALVPLAALAVAAFPRAQDAPDGIDDLVGRIESGQDALEAFHALVQRAGRDRIAVLAPVNELMRTTEDAAARARCKVVMDAIVEDYLEEHKKREIEERYDDLKTACRDLLDAAREEGIAGSGKVERALEQFEASLANPEPLDAPPLRVPGRRRPAGEPKAPPREGGPEPTGGDLSGYEKIEVGGKTMLVPKDSLPEHYVAELVNGQLRIIRFDSEAEKKAWLEKNGKKKDSGKEENDDHRRLEKP